MFNGKMEILKISFGGLASAVTCKLGYSGKFLALLLLLMVVDTAMGWLLHFKKGSWNSKSARWGAVGKIVELLFVGVLYMLDYVFNIDYLKYIGIFYFGVCELASMVENMAGLNSDIPAGLGELLEKIKFSIGTNSVKKVRELAGKYIDLENKKEEEKEEDKP